MSTPMFPVPREAQATGATDIKWFAGLAMQSIIEKHNRIPDTEAEREEIALWAWRMGQAMAATEKRIHAERD